MSETIVFYSCAVLIGLDKGGVPGLGALGMAMVLSASHAGMGRTLAVFVPVLACADLWAVWAYRDAVEWRIIKVLSAPVVFGMIIGFLLVGKLPEKNIRKAVGVGLLGLSLFYNISKVIVNRKGPPQGCIPKELTSDDEESGFIKNEAVHTTHGRDRSNQHKLESVAHESASYAKDYTNDTPMTMYWAIFYGFFTGLLTVVANVAGPLVAVYLIVLKLPKRKINGTRAWLFLLANAIKIPCQILIGNLNSPDILLVLPLALIAGVTALATETFIFPYIRQALFERVSWLLVALGAIKLILEA
jgi:uncharacterized membrane protein YfcA